MQLIIISGLSGSGKSVALNALADADFYCVDNLPAALLIDTVHHLRQGGTTKVALTIDARTGDSLSQLPAALDTLKAGNIDVQLVFLDARQDSLLRRFSETRRRHPLATRTTTIEECIDRERALLEPIALLGQRIDTSHLNPNALRQWMKDLLQLDQSGMTLVFESFGFKEGIPLDADFVFDVRFLPNPHYDPKLRALTGLDPEVIRFLESIPDAGRVENDIRQFLATWLPAFVRDNRASLTIAIGCTGGQHRSVFLVERLARHFQGSFFALRRHRRLLKA